MGMRKQSYEHPYPEKRSLSGSLIAIGAGALTMIALIAVVQWLF